MMITIMIVVSGRDLYICSVCCCVHKSLSFPPSSHQIFVPFRSSFSAAQHKKILFTSVEKMEVFLYGTSFLHSHIKGHEKDSNKRRKKLLFFALTPFFPICYAGPGSIWHTCMRKRGAELVPSLTRVVMHVVVVVVHVHVLDGLLASRNFRPKIWQVM